MRLQQHTKHPSQKNNNDLIEHFVLMLVQRRMPHLPEYTVASGYLLSKLNHVCCIKSIL